MDLYFKISFVLFLFLFPSLSIRFVKEQNRVDTEALCLDGSSAFYYYEQKIISSTNLIVYFMGNSLGQFCGGKSLSESLDNCLLIRESISNEWKPTLEINSGLLADPKYSDFAKVIIPDCDGSLFQGYNQNVTQYKSKSLYFRGNRILKSHFNSIAHKRYNITKINNVIFAGSGLGAIGASIWARYFQDQILWNTGLTKTMKLILDSVPISYISSRSNKNEYETALAYLTQLSNVNDINPHILCTLRYEGQEWRCFLFQVSYIYLNFNVLIIDSQYDQYSSNRILEIGCVDSVHPSLANCSPAEINYLNQYRSAKIVFMLEFVNFKANSVWSVSCVTNYVLNNNNYEILEASGQNISVSIDRFLKGGRITAFDAQPWPSNKKCSGL